MKSKSCWAFLLASSLLASCLFAQAPAQLTVAPIARVAAKRGGVTAVTSRVTLADGLHCNSNAPNDEYLIPLRLTWDAKDLGTATVEYPKAKLEKSEFSAKPVSVFEGTFDIVTKFAVPATAPAGMGMAEGKLRYQACNSKMCFPPKTVSVKFTYDLR
jgi:hypothetical protein